MARALPLRRTGEGAGTHPAAASPRGGAQSKRSDISRKDPAVPDRRTRRLLPSVLALVLAAGAAACGRADDESAGPERGPADVEDVTDGDEPITEPDRFVGQTVTVSGEVSDLLGPSSFEIAGEDAGGEGLLVVGAAQAPTLDADAVVKVTGTVRDGFDVAEAERDLGLTLDDERFSSFLGRHYVAASSVEVLPANEG